MTIPWDPGFTITSVCRRPGQDQAEILISPATMTASKSTSHYALGSTDAEHERLIRQARWLTPHSERCFREAGIGPGQRVLDVGSGVGDVALVLARLVGPTGEVLGVERDARSIDRAIGRIAKAGLHNVSFTQADVSQVPCDKIFDAAVGRYILMFVSDPASLLRSLLQLVRPGGVLAFQEPDWGSFLENSRSFPLWSAGASLMVETFHRSGTNINLGPQLSQVFQQAGLPEPTMRTDVLAGAEEWMPDVLQSLHPRMKQLNLNVEPLGDFHTLSHRLHAEIAAANAQTPLPSLVSAWCRKPVERVAD